jgi:potassium-transporting ATPase KdpC subunit
MFTAHLKRSILMLVVMTVLTGLVYPAVVTGLARALFPWQANGSILTRAGSPVGSALIGQRFTDRRYFHGRPSAAGKDGYDAMASGGSNLGPTNKALITSVEERAKQVRQENGLAPDAPVPSDLVTASAGGLDPDISPAAADLQAPRVAAARGLSEARVREVIARETRPPALGIIGMPRVNVLALNQALDLEPSGMR